MMDKNENKAMIEAVALLAKEKNIGKEVLCRFGKVQDCLKIDNLGCYARHCGKITCQQTQIAEVFFYLFNCYVLLCHNYSIVFSAAG